MKRKSYDRIFGRLASYGALAPSLYNGQPWRFTVGPERLEVQAEASKARGPELDPLGRDLHMALGACLDHIALAAPGLGYEAVIEFLPDGSNPFLAGRVSLRPLPETMPEPLFAALLTRQSHAGKYKEGSVGQVHLDRLAHLEPPSPSLKAYFLLDPEKRGPFHSLLHDLSHEGAGRRDLVEEGARWIGKGKGREEGLSVDFLGLPLSARVRFACLSPFDPAGEVRELSRQALLRQGHGVEAPAFLLVTVLGRSPRDLLDAGRWWSRILLTLSEMELASQSLHLPLVLPGAAQRLAPVFGAGPGEEPVLLLRFGSPEKKVWPKTSRRH